MIRGLCYVVAAALFLGAAGYLLFGRDKGLGVFLLIIAVILCRILIINIAGQIEEAEAQSKEGDE